MVTINNLFGYFKICISIKVNHCRSKIKYNITVITDTNVTKLK